MSRPVILFIGRSAKVGRCVFFLVSHGDVVTIVSQNQRGALQLHLCAKSMIFYRCQMSLVSHQSLEICKGQRKCLGRTQLSVSRKSNQINRLTLQASNLQTKKPSFTTKSCGKILRFLMSDRAMTGINRRLLGSFSAGDLSVLPQMAPRPVISKVRFLGLSLDLGRPRSPNFGGGFFKGKGKRESFQHMRFSLVNDTPWKINMEPENDGLEDDFSFSIG